MPEGNSDNKPLKLRAGGMEETILRAVMHLDGEGYGVPIKQAVEEAMEKSLTYGGIYTSLDRLEEKGYVTSSWGEPTAERGGKRKQFFRITAEGMTALEEAQRAAERLRRAFPASGRFGEVGGAA